MGNIIRRMLESFYLKRMDVVLVGLENSGKTTLLGVLADGHPIDTVPTIGLDVRTLRRGRVQMKCWDLGGQEQYRSEWGRYTSGCDFDMLPTARAELHQLLENRELAKTPILIVANKVDLDPHVNETELIRELNLDYIQENPWIVVPCSALRMTNIDAVLSWLLKQSS